MAATTSLWVIDDGLVGGTCGSRHQPAINEIENGTMKINFNAYLIARCVRSLIYAKSSRNVGNLSYDGGEKKKTERETRDMQKAQTHDFNTPNRTAQHQKKNTQQFLWMEYEIKLNLY